MPHDLTSLLEAVAIGGMLAIGFAGCTGDDKSEDVESGCPTEGCPTAACPTEGCPTEGCPTEGCPTEGCPTAGCPTGDAQTPPEGHEAITTWLAGGAYLDWACEPAAHPQGPASPHGPNRICSNDLLSAHTTGEYPVGSASVKELYDATSTTIIGYAVSLHHQAGTTGGDWYWYEVVPVGHPAPHDANGVVADGYGNSGAAMTICTGCHAAAGADADHSGHDFVYTQVP